MLQYKKNNENEMVPYGFIEKFLGQVEKCPDKIAVEMIPSRKTYTYADILRIAESIRANLKDMGVEKGNRIVVMLPSSVEFIASVLAITSLGSMAVLVGGSLTDYELRPRIQDSKPSGAIVFSEKLQKPLLECKSLNFALTVEKPSSGVAGNGIRIGALINSSNHRETLEQPSGNPRTGCHFTYKGFGYPLGAVHRYNDYSWVLEGLKKRFGNAAYTNHLLALPMYPVFGLMATFFSLSLGTKLFIIQNLKNIDLYKIIEKERIGSIGLVPMLIESLIEQGIKNRNAGRNPKKYLVNNMEILSSGSFLNMDISQKFEDIYGFAPYQGYGSSETLPIISCYSGKNQLGTVGTPMKKEFDISIVDLNGRVLKNNAIGQVAIKSPTLCREYINRPNETKSIYRNGKMITGDLGYKDAEGQLFFVGRHMRFTKIAAQMTDLVEIENVINSHPLVERSIATGRINDRNHEYVCIDVSSKPGASLSKFSLIEYCRKHVATHKIPREINVMERKKRYYLSHPETAWEGMQ